MAVENRSKLFNSIVGSDQETLKSSTFINIISILGFLFCLQSFMQVELEQQCILFSTPNHTQHVERHVSKCVAQKMHGRSIERIYYLFIFFRHHQLLGRKNWYFEEKNTNANTECLIIILQKRSNLTTLLFVRKNKAFEVYFLSAIKINLGSSFGNHRSIFLRLSTKEYSRHCSWGVSLSCKQTVQIKDVVKYFNTTTRYDLAVSSVQLLVFCVYNICYELRQSKHPIRLAKTTAKKNTRFI